MRCKDMAGRGGAQVRRTGWLKIIVSRCTPASEDNQDFAMTAIKLPAESETKEDVRAEIDRIDRALIELTAERHAYVTRMAWIKTHQNEANDPARMEGVIGKVRERALAHDLDQDQAELIWRRLIDWNINYEKGILLARTRNK